MKKARTILASVLFGTTIGNAQAQDFCFQPNNFVDVFRLSGISSAANTCHSGVSYLLCPNTFVFGIEFTNYGGTDTNYSIPLVGGQVNALNSNPRYGFIGLHGVNTPLFNSPLFGGHSDCTFTYQLGLTYPILSISCDGGVPGIWTKSVAAHTINCTSAVPVPVPSAKALGRCRSDPIAC